MQLLELSPSARRFISTDEEMIYTVIPDGFGTYIVICNDAYGDIKIDGSNLTKESLFVDYKITIDESTLTK